MANDEQHTNRCTIRSSYQKPPVSYVSELKDYLVNEGFTRNRSRPYHPMTQRKFERYYRSLDGDDLRKALIKVSKECGLKGCTRVHDFSHTSSSLMQLNGVVRELLLLFSDTGFLYNRVWN